MSDDKQGPEKNAKELRISFSFTFIFLSIVTLLVAGAFIFYSVDKSETPRDLPLTLLASYYFLLGFYVRNKEEMKNRTGNGLKRIILLFPGEIFVGLIWIITFGLPLLYVFDPEVYGFRVLRISRQLFLCFVIITCIFVDSRSTEILKKARLGIMERFLGSVKQ